MFTIDLSPPDAECAGASQTQTAVKTHTPSPAAVKEAKIDAELVARFNAGDESAFLEIERRYRAKLFGTALNFLRNRADAEEIAQDALFRAYRALPRFRGESSLATWLTRITANLAKNRYWFLQRRGRSSALSLDFKMGDEGSCSLGDLLPSDTATPAQEAVCGEFDAIVLGCVRRLEESHREILTLRNAHQMSYGEIAGKLGINEGTVKSRLARARERLRKLIVLECPEFGEDAVPEDFLEPVRDVFAAAAA